MQNPFRSEAEAYRFLLLTVGAFAAIAIAAYLNAWAGLAVAIAAGGVFAFLYLRRGEPPAPVRAAPVRQSGDDERRILVVANETVGGRKLLECVQSKTEGVRNNVLVVSPALNSPLRHWTSDDGDARAAAQKRLDSSLERLREAGVEARGEIGDSDPLQAVEDALRTFGADEIVISTHPEGRSNWLERGIVRAARERFAVPITHVVVDLEAEREEVR